MPEGLYEAFPTASTPCPYCFLNSHVSKRSHLVFLLCLLRLYTVSPAPLIIAS
jgi:coproporphyrinogen III oxidase-like Fe-S oxidoreductase